MMSRFSGYGDFVGIPQVFLGYKIGMGIEIQPPQQPWRKGLKAKPILS